MGTEDFSRELINYLYDEMSTEERQQFEIAMEHNPELKKEFEELREMRKGLAQIQDKEVMEPFFLWGKNGSAAWGNVFKRPSLLVFKPFIAVAASLVVVLLIGYLTHFSISYQDQRLYIGFNQESTSQDNTFTQDEVARLVNQEIARNNAYILSKLTATENNMETKFAALESSQNEKQIPSYLNADVVTKKELDVFLSSVRTNNLKMLQTYLETSSAQQQDYFQAVLTEFSDYMENQREEDLRLIRRSLINMQETQQAQKQETDQILASILTSVNIEDN